MKNLIVACLFLVGTVAFAQENFNAEGELGKMIQTPNSPEAQAFGGYGSVPINLRTGTPNISVPLYTYKGLEMDLPISLTYDIHARKVEDIASGMGMGWNLNLGGRIVRNVNGLADNYISVNHGTGGDYLTLYKDGTVRNDYEKFQGKYVNDNPAQGSGNVFTDEAEVWDYFRFLDRAQTNKWDITLDSYSISAPGLNDRVLMYLDTSTSPSVIKPIAMNDPKLTFTHHNGAFDGINSKWEITDGTGTTYHFEEQEVTHSFNGMDIASPFWDYSGPTQMEYVSSWLLTKIVSPNGKDEYVFTYSEPLEWKQPINTWETQRIDFKNIHTNQWESRSVDAGSSYKIDQRALTTVTHNGNIIVDISLVERTDLLDVNNLGLENQIEKITIKSPLDGSVMNTFKFTHSLFGPTNWSDTKEVRLKLDKIEIGGKGSSSPTYDYEKEYTFVYDRAEMMPPTDSSAQDVFGCYNGQGHGQDLFPAPENGDPAVPNPGGGDRSFDFSDAMIGILTEMHYPTEGYSKFIYGEHIPGNTEANGIRIDSIVNYSDAGVMETKKAYEYLDQRLDGFALPDLQYSKPRRYFHNTDAYTSQEYYRSAKGTVGDQPYVTYGKVIERDIDVVNDVAINGRTESVFYNYNSSSKPTGIRNWTAPPFPSEYFTHVSQGQLKEQYIYDQAGNLLSQSLTELDTDTGFYDFVDYPAYSVGDNGNFQLKFPLMDSATGGGVLVYYVEGDYSVQGPVIPTSECNQATYGCINVERYARIATIPLNNRIYYNKKTKGTSTQYLDGGTVTTTSTNQYDPNNFYLPSESESTTSDSNETVVAKYLYPSDLTDPYMSNLIADNRIASPIQTENYLRESGSDLLLATQKTLFQDSGGLILPLSIQASRRGDGLETRVQFQEYDSKGNPVQMKKANGTPTVYVWGYDSRLPVAKIENATYTQVGALVNLSAINSSLSNSFIETQIGILRQSLPESMVTTYLYNPQLQVSSIIDPRGYESFFFYDDENRLQRVEDQNGHVLSHNEYNYRINN